MTAWEMKTGETPNTDAPSAAAAGSSPGGPGSGGNSRWQARKERIAR
jgi:hypothetical protein